LSPAISRGDSDFSTLRIVKERQPILCESLAKAAQAGMAFANDLMSEVMVEDDGIEPTTPCLQSRCSPS
jgi:hypothetical protein